VAWTLRCVEPSARPAQTSVDLENGGQVRLYILNDQSEYTRGMRRTILRLAHLQPPAQAQLLATLEVSGGGLLVLDISKQPYLEMIRGEARSRLANGFMLKQNTRIEIVISPVHRFEISLNLSSQAARDVGAMVGGGSTRTSHALAAQRGAMWLVPTIWTLMTDADDVVIDNLKALARRLHLSEGSVRYLTTISFYLLSMVVVWYYQGQKADTAVAAAAAAQSDMQKAEAGRAASLQSEAECLRSRQALVAELDEKRKVLSLKAELALGFSKSQAAALDIAGDRLTGNELQKRDDSAHIPLISMVAAALEDREPPKEAKACLEYEALLGTDLPRYVLLWHPDRELVCPVQFSDVADGIPIAGRWGISDRVVAEFGTKDPAVEATGISDVRLDDRWSAHALSSAMRSIQTTILDYDGDGRPVLLPSQAQLWALTLFGAYNQMPRSPDGVLDQPITLCLNEILDRAARNGPPPIPGTPILPNIYEIATGDVELTPERTPGCPWPAAGLKPSAEAAIRAVTTLASLPDEVTP
jgi:hypothetical protein